MKVSNSYLPHLWLSGWAPPQWEGSSARSRGHLSIPVLATGSLQHMFAIFLFPIFYTTQVQQWSCVCLPWMPAAKFKLPLCSCPGQFALIFPILKKISLSLQHYMNQILCKYQLIIVCVLFCDNSADNKTFENNTWHVHIKVNSSVAMRINTLSWFRLG